jgi:hypothetical protein
MGDHKIDITSTKAERVAFIRHLLDDIKSLEYMLENNLIEDDIVRIGAEQEFCLVNSSWRPANNAVGIFERINDEHFTTELAKYNLEINLDPVKLEKGAFKEVKNQLYTVLKKAKKYAEEQDSKVILTGILPTISMHELDLDYMTPAPRYYALNDVMKASKGSDFRMHFNGVDEFTIKHNSVMFEENTSK